MDSYGFKKSHYSIIRFAQLIGMKKTSAKFRIIEKTIRDLREEHLDAELSPSVQGSSLRLIGNELKGKHPHVFTGENGPKHLYIALQVVMEHHQRKRSRLKSKQQVQVTSTDTQPMEDLQDPIEKVIIDLTDDQPADIGSESSNVIHVNVKPTKKGPTERALRKSRREAKKVASTSSLARQHEDGSPPPQHTSSASSAPAHAQRSRPSGSGRTTRAAAAAATQIPPAEAPAVIEQTDEVHDFLGTCQPPMTHHLQRFVDFGCTTSPYLRSVSRWPAEQRYKLLKRILESGERDAGVSPSEMDIAILEHQFDTYFMED